MLESFKEILIRKTSDENLITLIKFMDPNILADKTVEALNKMAVGKKGMLVNNAVRDFAKEMDPELEPHMMRDAIGHHVSRYKAAVEKGDQRLANRHANQAFKIMNLANISEPHSMGKINVDFVDPKPWERQKYTDKYTDPNHPKVKEGKVKVGDFITGCKGLNYSKGGGLDKDYSFLQKQPHESYSRDVSKHGNNKAYPFEKVKINGKYINIDDIDPKSVTSYVPHEFDMHPIMNHFEEPTSKRDQNSDTKYYTDRDKYYGDMEHIGKFFDRHQKMQEDNPDAYSLRGMAPSAPVHKLSLIHI